MLTTTITTYNNDNNELLVSGRTRRKRSILLSLVLVLSCSSSISTAAASSIPPTDSTPTSSPQPSPSPTTTPSSSPQPSPSPTTTPSTASPSITPTTEPTDSPQPSPLPTITPSVIPSPIPSDSPAPSPGPSRTRSSMPTLTTSTNPTQIPTFQPTNSPRPSPSPSNAPLPTYQPTDSPKPSPSPSRILTTSEQLEDAITVVKKYLLQQEQSNSDTDPPVSTPNSAVPSNSRPLMPLIFLGGQSNMQGLSDQAANHYERQNPNGGPGLQLSTLLPILQQQTSQSAQKLEALKEEIIKVESQVVNRTIAELEANALLDIQRRYPTIFNNDELLEEDNSISCSYTPMKLSNVSKPIRPLPMASPLKAVLYRGDPSRCGEPWGLELILGQVLKTIPAPTTSTTSTTTTIAPNNNNNNSNRWTLIKLAAGSTELYKDWSHSYEQEYNTINVWTANLVPRLQLITDRKKNRIHPECATTSTPTNSNDGLYDCRWTAIVWFQGENDTFQYDNAIQYKEHLTTFFADLRQEMFRNKKTVYSSSPDEIPIVVVGIGRWRTNTIEGKLVLRAQQDFCNDDSNNAIFVSTHEDLSHNYHYEAASMLILGDRIAQALSTLFSRNRITSNKTDYSDHKNTMLSLSTKGMVPNSVWDAIQLIEEIQTKLEQEEAKR